MKFSLTRNKGIFELRIEKKNRNRFQIRNPQSAIRNRKDAGNRSGSLRLLEYWLKNEKRKGFHEPNKKRRTESPRRKYPAATRLEKSLRSWNARSPCPDARDLDATNPGNERPD